jgi:hypothetical protein
VPLTTVLDAFTLPANADDHSSLQSNDDVECDSRDDQIFSPVDDATCELILTAHINKQVDPMIGTLRKDRHQQWKHIEKLDLEILIFQEEATPKPSEGLWQTLLLFLPLKRHDRPVHHHLQLEVSSRSSQDLVDPTRPSPFRR